MQLAAVLQSVHCTGSDKPHPLAEFFKIEKGCMLAGQQNKQTNTFYVAIIRAVRAVTIGKALPLSLQPTIQEWAVYLQR